MLIRYVSDLHLEFSAVDLPQLPNDSESTLILAGDIGNFTSHVGVTLQHLNKWSQQFKYIIYVFGNHDLYHTSVGSETDAKALIAQDGLSNVFLLNKETVTIDNVSFIGATLWTDYNKSDRKSMNNAQYAMADYRYINKESSSDKIDPLYILKVHDHHKFFIFDEAKKAHENGYLPVVITHHLPSYSSVHPFYAGSDLNSAFASDLDNEIIHSDIHTWFHGHTHHCFDYKLGETHIRCNPRGYVIGKRIENANFNPILTVTI